ncbi:hypothetical protein NDU88_002639 [Pleurodeles waltl]|uniref:Uncharacterized protein n=1 Tax=Pleurodeles waltl TaxID=8319 RepID=A0AAV7UXZ0_PLEWA|nr:hypothetical protein NDU88_002639 [Pleurodeles waltl]
MEKGVSATVLVPAAREISDDASLCRDSSQPCDQAAALSPNPVPFLRWPSKDGESTTACSKNPRPSRQREQT